MGTYCGSLSKKGYNLPKKITAMCLAIGALAVIARLLGKVPGFIVYYSCTITGLFFITIACLLLERINSSALERCLKWFGTYTLELYLCHIACRQFFNCPYDFISYITLCFVVPIPLAMLLRKTSTKIIDALYPSFQKDKHT